jgi:hypothetical protein
MKKSTVIITLVALAIGVACAVLLLSVARKSYPTSAVEPVVNRREPPKTATPAAPVAAVADADPLDASALALVDAIERALAKGDARPREAVLTFKDEAGLQRFVARAQAAGLTILGQLAELRAVRVRFNDFAGLQNELLANADDYAATGANNLISVPGAPSKEERAAVDQVPFHNETLAFLGANGDRSAWGRGVTIAILDTGVATSDVTFGVGRVRALDIGLGLTPATAGEAGHGTAVAALAAGAASDAAGVAPAANLLSIRVTDNNSVSDLFTVSQAIVAAVQAGAKIINVSLGGYSNGSVLDNAIHYATQHGALIVAAAGNDQAAQLSWPAADSRVVSVGAVDRAEQQVYFSNSSEQLRLSAPGYGVQTAWLNGERVYVDGTSASAPLVSGAIAALMSQSPSLTPAQAADLLARTANDSGQPGADAAFGRGILNLATAMNSANLGYIDTAVSSHFYNASTGQMEFVVQNRSGRSVSGMTLAVSNGDVATNHTVPPLAPGETYVAKVPVTSAALKPGASVRYSTQLSNPTGVVDQVPANNKRSTVLTQPKR